MVQSVLEINVHERRKASNFDRALEWVEIFVNTRLPEITAELAGIRCALKQPTEAQGLNAAVAAVFGRRNKMAVVPVPQLLDTEKILLSVMPRKADGHVDAEATVSWTTSDVGQVPVEVGSESFVFHDDQFNEDVTCPGAFNAFALTPNASGTGTVTASAPGYEAAEFGPINYAPGVARSLNPSVGSPISDL